MERNTLEARTSCWGLQWQLGLWGCLIPVSHKLNPDGYFRKNINGKLQMVHRWLFEQKHGPVPEGFSVHHTCGCRACCNVDHLELISKKEHAGVHNRERYAGRRRLARIYWERTNCTGTRLAEVFDTSFGSACRWIRDWKDTH